MKLVIEHGKTKRFVVGPFAICCSRHDLERIMADLDKALRDGEFSYGWIHVDEHSTSADFDIIKRQKSIPNTEPIAWDDSKEISSVPANHKIPDLRNQHPQT